MWLALAFLSAFLLGFYDVSKKISLADNAVIPVLLLNTLFCFLFFSPCILGSSLGWIHETSIVYVPHADWEVHKYIVLKALIVLSAWFLGYLAIKNLPLTIVGPVQATRPVMVLVGAVLIFNEHLNLWQWAGVSLAVVSFYLMSVSGKKEGILFTHNKWIACLVLSAICGAVSGLYDKMLLSPVEQGGMGFNRMVVQSWYNLYQFIFMSVILLFVWLPRRKAERFHWKWTILLISIFLSVADFMYFYALSYPDAMISIVSMIRRSSVLVSFVVGALVFREHNIKVKAVELGLVLLSMVFLWIGTN